MMSRNPLDFHKGHRLTPAIVVGEEVDDHHVFPQKYLRISKQGVGIDSVLNHTLIDKLTNIRIGGNAPSKYLADMQTQLGVAKVRSILRSHGLPADHDGPLNEDRFQDFLGWRQKQLAKRLREAVSG
jgi:hypothetical protein